MPNQQQLLQQGKCLFEFSCPCGDVIEYQSSLKEHYYKCNLMNVQYGELVNVIVKYNHKNLNLRDKRSISALVGMLSNEIYKSVPPAQAPKREYEEEKKASESKCTHCSRPFTPSEE